MIHHSPTKISTLYKNLAGKAIKFFKMAVLLIGDGYFCIARVIIITVFHDNFGYKPKLSI